MTEPRALLFDLDGTLIDSRRDIADALNRTLERSGRPTLPLEAVLPMIGDGARMLVCRAYGRPEPEVDQELDWFKAFYVERPCVHTVLLPGARESLALGLPTAIVTNKPKDITRLVLASLGVSVSFLWGGGDGPLKPDPAGVAKACEALGVAPHDAWMIGDGPQDILAGRAAGCFTVAVPGIADGSHLDATKPDLVLSALADLPTKVRPA